MDKNELEQKIHELEKQSKIRKAKTIAGFAVAYFLAFYFLDKPPEDVYAFVRMVFVSLILAFIHFAVNDVVFDHIHSANEAEQETIKMLKEQLDNTNECSKKTL